MPALLTSMSIDWKRESAVSTILAAVAGSPMSPSTRATRSEDETSVDWVTRRELATPTKPCTTNRLTIPAPIPCEAPVTMAVFRGPLMVGYLENVLSPNDRAQIRWHEPEASARLGCTPEVLRRACVQPLALRLSYSGHDHAPAKMNEPGGTGMVVIAPHNSKRGGRARTPRRA